MKKLVLTSLIFIFSLTSPSLAKSEVYHLLRLKNGGELVTPRYWVENSQLFFFYAGGIVGIEKQSVDRVEKREIERTVYRDATSVNAGKKPLPPSPAKAEKSPAPGK
ncbi:MAG: hypothetical protein Q8P44_09635, partial [Dehalococcoidia bacterium]|nr:hypothetical protein [Dehalococcoidia bacterium]